MTLAERLYRLLARLYPAQHRQAYGEAMLQHARDLGRDAQPQGGWQVARLCGRLLIDGIVNAGGEHWEAIMSGNERFKPAAWLIVLLAALPGLLMALSRRSVAGLGPLLAILGYAYLGLLVIGVPIFWRRQRQFPVWALLPAGALAWLLTYLAGTLLEQQLGALRLFGLAQMGAWSWISLLNLLVATVIFALVFHSQPIPVAFWLVLGVMLLVNLLAILTHSGSWEMTAEGLMLAAVGLLAARRQGLLALLVVIGGYIYMISDSDYLYGFFLQNWMGVTPYFLAMTALFLIVTPVAMLRAATRGGLALAVFLPAAIFLVARIAVPLLVSPVLEGIPWGDVWVSVNVMLSLGLGWVLYGELKESSDEVEVRS
jgi:hypothetical protein